MIFPTDDLQQFGTSLESKKILVGLDLGTKRIGIAISDTRRIIANPLTTIQRKSGKYDAEKICGKLHKTEIGGFIIGLPRNMNGSEGPRCQASRDYAKNIYNIFKVPVALWDERLTSVAADRILIDADATRKRRKLVIDHVAASLFLQSALDYLNKSETSYV